MPIAYELAAARTADLPLLLPFWEDAPLDPAHALLGLSAGNRAYLSRLTATIAPKGKQLVAILWPEEQTAAYLFGLGKREKITPFKLRRAIRELANQLRKTGIREIAVALDDFASAGFSGAELLKMLGTELSIASYEYKEFKTAPEEPKPSLERVVFIGTGAGLDDTVAHVNAVGGGLAFTRDLANRPANILFPNAMAEAARHMAESHGLLIHVLDEHRLERMEGFKHHRAGLLLAVGMSSNNPPRLIALEHHGGPADQPPIVLVGKGITFDTGGVNVKPWKGMRDMRLDMSGAAAVLGAMQAIAELKVPANVIGICAVAENAIGPNAMRPSDVVRALDGTTVEIAHTDAEGRLVLADALAFAHKYNPAVVLDAATLTGSAVVALGTEMGALFTQDDALAERLLALSREVGEPFWRLPMTEEYEDIAEGTLGDVVNVGKMDPYADAIAGAMFLHHFAKPMRWAHLDIAGLDLPGKGSGLSAEVAAGPGVRLFVAAAQAYAAGKL